MTASDWLITIASALVLVAAACYRYREMRRARRPLAERRWRETR